MCGCRLAARLSMNAKIMTAIIVMAIAALVAALALASFASTRGNSGGAAAPSLKGINVSYVDSVTGWNYTVLSSSNTSDFGPQLKAEGYMDMYETEFIAGYFNYSGTYPDTITLVVYRMRNSSSAAAAETNLLSSVNINSNLVSYNYTFFEGNKPKTVKIYEIYAVEAENITNVTHSDIPVYQESAVFFEGNTIGSVTSNGGRSVDSNVSAVIAEKLAGILAAGASSQN